MRIKHLAAVAAVGLLGATGARAEPICPAFQKIVAAAAEPRPFASLVDGDYPAADEEPAAALVQVDGFDCQINIERTTHFYACTRTTADGNAAAEAREITVALTACLKVRPTRADITDTFVISADPQVEVAVMASTEDPLVFVNALVR